MGGKKRGKGSEKGKISAIIFDLDGTLVDSDPALVRVFKSAISRYKLRERTDEEILALRGSTLRGMAKKLFGRKKNFEEIFAYTQKHYTGWYLPVLARPFPDVENGLKELGEKYRLGLVTNAGEAEAGVTIYTLKLEKYFATMIAMADESKAKPKPDMLIEAMKRLGAKKEETIYVGDTKIDVLAAKRAGIRVLIRSRPSNAKIRAEKFGEIGEIPHLL